MGQGIGPVTSRESGISYKRNSIMVACQWGSLGQERKLHGAGEKWDNCSIILEQATQVTSSVQMQALPLSKEQGWFLHSN